jgi:hypothetical protein
LIIDNAGLTVPGGNPLRLPVRFFVAGTGQADNVSIEIKQTDPSDPGGLRIFYNKPGSVFTINRPQSWASGQAFSTTCGVYAVTGVSGANGTKINIVGGTAEADWLTVHGGLIGDRVEFNGRCKVIFPGERMARRLDPASGVGFSSGYWDE